MSSSSSVITPSRPVDGLSMYLVEQRWQQPDIADIPQAVVSGLAAKGMLAQIAPGASVAITAGSRGIAAMTAVLQAVIGAVRSVGGLPFLFPAMGSHGGGTAEGQLAVLADLGITEETMGAPIRASMDVVHLGETLAGVPVYQDRIASEADHVILVNRIKKHTNIDGMVESGLVKMAVIGMGKHTQASALHRYGNQGLARNLLPVGEVALSKANVLGGVGLVENAWGGLAEIPVLSRDEIINQEPALLLRSKTLGAKIPFSSLDMLIVEQMGKDISGTGMDCYVIGRRRIIGEPEWDEAPKISSLVLLGLSPGGHGNGVGIGLADFTTERLVAGIDWSRTRANILTSGNLERGKIPLAFATDQQAIEAASFRERVTPVNQLRVACVRDTLHLRQLLISEALLAEARASSHLALFDGPKPLPLSADGQWISPLVV